MEILSMRSLTRTSWNESKEKEILLDSEKKLLGEVGRM